MWLGLILVLAVSQTQFLAVRNIWCTLEVMNEAVHSNDRCNEASIRGCLLIQPENIWTLLPNWLYLIFSFFFKLQCLLHSEWPKNVTAQQQCLHLPGCIRLVFPHIKIRPSPRDFSWADCVAHYSWDRISRIYPRIVPNRYTGHQCSGLS